MTRSTRCTIFLLLSFLSISAISLGQYRKQFHTQDSTTVADKDLRQAAALIEEGKGYYLELVKQREINDTLLLRINVKDRSIRSLETMDKVNQQILFNKDQQMAIKDNIMAGKDANITYLTKTLKRQKAKTFIITALGISAIVYLLIK